MMTEQVTLRVRPGFVHGAKRQFQAGDAFSVPEAEAVQLLAAFGDKLERVQPAVTGTLPVDDHGPQTAEGTPLLEDNQTSEPAVETETPEKPERRARKSGGL